MLRPAEAPHRALDLRHHPPHPRPMGGDDPHLRKPFVSALPTARLVEAGIAPRLQPVAPQLRRPPINLQLDPAASAVYVNHRHSVGMHRPPAPPHLVTHRRVRNGGPFAQGGPGTGPTGLPHRCVDRYCLFQYLSEVDHYRACAVTPTVVRRS